VQGGAGVFVSIIAVTHGSEKQTTKLKKNKQKNLYGKCGLFFRFSGRTIGTAGDDMPTVCDVQSTTRVDLERDYNRASWQRRCCGMWPRVGDGKSTQHHNTV
jgi:hypothetical protein